MARRVVVIVNPSAGQSDSTLPARITDVLRAPGLEVAVAVARHADDIAALTDAAVRDRCSTVVAAGGDGTVSGVASRIAATNVVLGVLPCGTLNHFAKDLNIPLELEGAAAVIAGGHAARVDVGEVNGRYFVNNSSLGLYPSVVLERRQQQLQGRGKWGALLIASLKVWRRYPRMLVVLKTDNGLELVRTPLVFIGNNAYSLSGFDIAARRSLNEGRLSVHVATNSRRVTLVWLFARAAAVGLDDASAGLELLMTSEVEIRSGARRLRVALDGEITMMPTPLRYRSRPGLLRVLVPADGAKPRAQDPERSA